MANDIYLKIDGVEGECNHKGAEKHIQLLSWKCGLTNQSTAGDGGGHGVGKAEPHHLEFTHHYDKASPVLMRHCAAGKHLPSVKLIVCKAGGGQKEYLTITLKNAFVSHVTHDCGPDGTIGTVQLAYEDIEHEYKPQDKEGNVGGSVKAGWNITTTETR
jgi:type VI secretion system secreted protein Hcp